MILDYFSKDFKPLEQDYNGLWAHLQISSLATAFITVKIIYPG